MKETKHRYHRKVFTLVLIKQECNDPKAGSLLLGFKTKKLVRRLKKNEGFWMAPGGRLKRSDRSLKHCAQREVMEEVGIFLPLRSMVKVATLNIIKLDGRRFAFVHVYLVTKKTWDLNAIKRNNREMEKTNFYPLDKVFRDSFKMLPRDKDWLRFAVNGRFVRVQIVIGSDRTDVREFSCRELSLLFRSLAFSLVK